MVFKIGLIPSAKKELEEAIDYYFNIYNSLTQKFLNEFENLIRDLETNPFYEKKYAGIRSRNLKSFPYCIHFIVDEEKELVSIIAIAFAKQKQSDFQERIK